LGGERKILLVVGLGNPGKAYEGSRHNAGFLVVEALAARLFVPLGERKFKARWGVGETSGSKTTLFQPLTFMNRSGEPVGQYARYFSISPEEILVVHDDLDLPCGRIRLVRGGGAGGHRGILSIMEHLGHASFARLKLGIGRPAHGEPVESYVLNAPYAHERDEFQSMIERGVEAVETALAMGLDVAMNRFNAASIQTRNQPPVPSAKE
jgi:peptidyl-tRNA hydrolase, PTH1 family